jgi:hypothetical protein
VRERIERGCHALNRRTLLAVAIGAIIPGAQGAQAQRTEQAGSVGEIKGEAFAEARRERRVLGLAAPCSSTTSSRPARTRVSRCISAGIRRCGSDRRPV